MTAVLHIDANLSRTFQLNPKDKDHLRTLTFNARTSNLVNHTNVTAVNTVLSSGKLGQPLTAGELNWARGFRSEKVYSLAANRLVREGFDEMLVAEVAVPQRREVSVVLRKRGGTET